jgi:ABC-2 type transport system permease protein
VNGRRIFADFLVFSRGYFRSPIGLFFSLVFPIILIVLFGVIFSSPPQSVTLVTENLDHNSPISVEFLAALNSTGALKVNVVTPPAGQNFSAWLADQGDPVGLVIPAGFAASYQNRTAVHVVLYTDPADPSSSGIAEGAVQGVVNGFNLKAVGGTQVLGVTNLVEGAQVHKYIDYLVPGLIGFSILTSPMFSMVDISATYRKEGLFRQLSLTPLTKAEWLTAKVLWYIVLTFISAALMITVGVLAFGAHVGFSLGLIPYMVFGPLFFVALGMLAGSVTRTPETAAVVGNVVTFPMMFLSGTFFPVSSFSPPLQVFAHVLPLYYVIDGMDQVMLFGNQARALTDVVIVLIGAIVVFIAAVSVFRWRDE